MKFHAIVLGPIWLGVCKTEHCIGLGVAMWPFKPQLQAFIAAPYYVPMVTFRIARSA